MLQVVGKSFKKLERDHPALSLCSWEAKECSLFIFWQTKGDFTLSIILLKKTVLGHYVKVQADETQLLKKYEFE